MEDSAATVKEFYAQKKADIENRLDSKNWKWSIRESLLLDECVVNMESGS